MCALLAARCSGVVTQVSENTAASGDRSFLLSARRPAIAPPPGTQAAELYATAQHLGLEVLATAAPTADSISAAAALSANSGMVCVRADHPDALLTTIPFFPEGVIRLASYQASDDPDVRVAWALRDAGFNGLLTSDSLLMQSTVERVEIQTILKAIRAKGSAKYGKGSSLGRGEGAKEILGTIAI